MADPDAVAASQPPGLTSGEAEALRARFGPNDAAPRKHRSAALELARLFLNPLVLILLIAGTLSGSLGEWLNAWIIVAIAVFSVAMEFTQTWRSTRAIEALRLRVAPTATARRDGEWREIPIREIVPGDLVRLAAGDLVPADCRLVSARDLFVLQAALTGESLPVEKDAAEDPPSTRADARNMVFLGTSVVSGTALATVVTTGTATTFGDIAARLAERPERTAFDLGLERFSRLIARAVTFLVLFLIVAAIALHRDPLQSVLFAVALAVGLTPEFLPMITTITLAQGAQAMARQKVIVKHLPAIQNLGGVDILASDKTGTLTTGNMRVARSVDADGRDSPRPLALARLNSLLQTGIRSPLDAALLAADASPEEGITKLDEIPFDFERRRVSVVVERGGERQLIAKGAPESVLGVSASRAGEETGATPSGAAGAVVPLDAAGSRRAAQVAAELGAEGFRVLAVAYARVEPRERYSPTDERDLTLAGFVAFGDPPRPEAAATLASLAADGVRVKIVTGDGAAVSEHVAREVGLETGATLTGEELERETDAALGHLAETTSLFVRIAPAQKTRIVRALRGRGHVVGALGDGINDAPSLRAADVGISVASAVDVARDAADIILLEPGLAVLHAGILEGRRAFGNVMKFLFMETSSNFGNMLSMAAAAFFLPFLPMLPTQILLNNFLYDVAQITIPTDHVDPDFLRRPQQWDIRLIRDFMLWLGPISSLFDFLTFWVLLRVFHAGEAEFHTGWFVESLATQTLVVFVIRTARNPLRSRPSAPLAATALAVVAIAVALPYTPLAAPLGFTPLPARFFAFLAGAAVVYLAFVEVAKRVLLSRSRPSPA